MIKIGFDKRLELVFGLQYCVFKDNKEGYNIFFESNKDYCFDFLEIFNKYASEELIEYIKMGGFDTYDRTASIALLLDDNYCLDEKVNCIASNPYFNREKMEKLIQQFVKDSNYEEFYNNYINYFEKVVDLFNNKLNKYVTFKEELFTNFFGYKLNDYEIKLYDFTLGSFGLNINDKTIFISNLFSAKDENEIVGIPDLIIKTLFHEFSHPYCNPLGEKYFSNKDTSYILTESKENGLQNSYNNGVTVINEYVVRSIELYLSNLYLPNDIFNLEKSINYHKKIGYVHIDEIFNLLSKKNKYKNFDEFYKNEIVLYFE